MGTAMTGLVALAVAMGIGRFAFTPILPMMQADGLLSVATGGWLASANYAGYLAGALSAALIRTSPSRVIRASLLAIAVTTLAMGITPTLAGWIVLRVLAGVASAWVLVSVSSWALGVLAALGRPRLGGVVFAGVGTGIAVAGALCLVLMHGAATAATAWATLGAVALLATATIWRGVGGAAATRTISPRARTARAGRRGETLRLVACYGVFGFGYIVPATFLPAMARHEIRDPLVFGWSWPIFGAAAALSTLVIALLPPRVDSRWQWAVSQALLAVGVALPALRPGLGAIMLAALLVGGTFVVITMLGMQEARRVEGEHATVLMAAMTSAFALGQIAGPLTVSALVAMGGTVAQALELAASLLALSAVVLVIGAPRGDVATRVPARASDSRSSVA
jgi:MFS family permease